MNIGSERNKTSIRFSTLALIGVILTGCNKSNYTGTLNLDASDLQTRPATADTTKITVSQLNLTLPPVGSPLVNIRWTEVRTWSSWHGAPSRSRTPKTATYNLGPELHDAMRKMIAVGFNHDPQISQTASVKVTPRIVAKSERSFGCNFFAARPSFSVISTIELELRVSQNDDSTSTTRTFKGEDETSNCFSVPSADAIADSLYEAVAKATIKMMEAGGAGRI